VEGAQAGQYIHIEHPPPPSDSLSDMPYHQKIIYSKKDIAKKLLPAPGIELKTSQFSLCAVIN
jgi:hypothetical protein